jgi:non-ribosomal peptide synthetase component F
MDRGIGAIVGMLAVLKAGGAYVPIDPTHPAGQSPSLYDMTEVETGIWFHTDLLGGPRD